MPRTSLLPYVLIVPTQLAPTLCAQAPPGYYASVDTTSQAALRATLHAVIKDHTRFPYTASSTDTWDILEQAQQDPNNAANIVDVYRNGSYVKIGGGVGPYNREHTWPKSFGFPNDGADNYPYTDCHQLFLSDSGYNTARNNRPYATTSALATEQPTLALLGMGGGSGVYLGNSNWYDNVTSEGRWETWVGRRGDVARGLMYLDVRYEGGNHGVTGFAEPDLILTDNLSLIIASNTGSNRSIAYMGMRSVLLQWHAQDPVDQLERDRNNAVFAHQGNRNPFVDHPEWVDCLFNGQCGDTVPPAAPAALVVTAQKQRVLLDWADNTEPDLAGYRVFRAPSRSGPFTQLGTALLPTSAFTDQQVRDGVPYFYLVRAVDLSGNVSGDSNVDMTRWPRNLPPPVAVVLPAPTGAPWINELHYDNTGVDTGEFVEIAGPAGTDLTGWTLIGYNGAGGAPYQTIPLNGALPSQQNGYGTRVFTWPGLQNGAPDGVALVDGNGALVEFLAYEGTFVAVGGPANGVLATAIPTSESEATPAGFSLQRQGNGHLGAGFTWSAAIAFTPGQVNTGQTLQ